MSKKWILLAVVPLLGLVACSKNERPASQAEKSPAPATSSQSTPAMPPSHPPTGDQLNAAAPATIPPVPKTVVVPEDVQKTWTAVVLEVMDKKTNKSQDVKVDIGKTAKVGNLEITVEHFLPDFTMGEGSMTSKSNETKNPAVKILVKEDGKEVYSGWRFSLYPQAHPMNLQDYDIVLKDFVKKS